MPIINKMISTLIPYLPKLLIYQFAKKYVAGVSQESALKTIQNLNDQGYLATLDILGEHTEDESSASSITNQYIQLYKEINSRSLDCNISLKPTHIGADISLDTYNANLKKIIIESERVNNFLRIDMESSKYTDFTINSFIRERERGVNIGTVFQAYLFRTYNDITKLDPTNLNIRLCKGIYKEHPKICINDRKKINENYMKILRYAFQSNIYVGIATHDTTLMESIHKLIKELNISNEMFEFQVLYGVPMHGWNKKNLDNGYKVRVYIPFGEDWYKYSIRRLKENPDIAGYIIKNLFKK